jgi:hypothetical protein
MKRVALRELANSSLMRVVAGAVIGLAGLYYYYAGPIDPGKIALGTETIEARETWQGQAITGARVRATRSIIDRLADSQAQKPQRMPIVLWLGNSQLHAINRYKPGDHLAPYWLIDRANCLDCFLPLGITLPNANIQEHYVLELDVTKHIPIKLVILELCFDDLREDGLRDEFELILDNHLRAELGKSNVGKEILTGWDASTKVNPDEEDVAGLQGFLQRPLEKFIVAGLDRVFPLWAARSYLRGQFLDNLYYFRNWVFGITPSTVRRMIAPRYARNMRALEAMMSDLTSQHIATIAYIAPIRHDVPMPYEMASYDRWKAEVAALAAKHDVTLLNLENLVPGDQWGSSHKDDIDFMHFQGRGHVLVANELRPEVLRLLAGKD